MIGVCASICRCVPCNLLTKSDSVTLLLENNGSSVLPSSSGIDLLQFYIVYFDYIFGQLKSLLAPWESATELRPRDLSDLVSRMALYCRVPSEARAILEGGVPSGASGLPRA